MLDCTCDSHIVSLAICIDIYYWIHSQNLLIWCLDEKSLLTHRCECVRVSVWHGDCLASSGWRAELMHAPFTVTTQLTVRMMNSSVITSTHNHSISRKTKHFIFNHFPVSYFMSCSRISCFLITFPSHFIISRLMINMLDCRKKKIFLNWIKAFKALITENYNDLKRMTIQWQFSDKTRAETEPQSDLEHTKQAYQHYSHAAHENTLISKEANINMLLS